MNTVGEAERGDTSALLFFLFCSIQEQGHGECTSSSVRLLRHTSSVVRFLCSFLPRPSPSTVFVQNGFIWRESQDCAVLHGTMPCGCANLMICRDCSFSSAMYGSGVLGCRQSNLEAYRFSPSRPPFISSISPDGGRLHSMTRTFFFSFLFHSSFFLLFSPFSLFVVVVVARQLLLLVR